MKRITITSTLKTLLFACFIVIILSAKNCDECFSLPVMMVKFIVCGLILFIGSIYYTRLFLKAEKNIFEVETIPLLETNEAVEEVPFSCEGTVETAERVLQSPYMDKPCVYYHSIKEEYVRRGKYSKWEVKENLVNFVPFYIADRRGKLRVDVTNLDDDLSGYKIDVVNSFVPDPDNSEIDGNPVLKHSDSYESKTYLGFIPSNAKVRFSEFILEPNTKVFAYGYITKENNKLTLHESFDHPLIISRKTKEAYVDEFYKGRKLVFFVHVLIALGFTISILSANYFLHLYQSFLFNILLIGNGIISGSIIFTIYNRMVALRERALTALSNIDIELKRRADLIPGIVVIVKEYSHHEEELQEFIAQARTQTVFQGEYANSPKTDFSGLLAIAEEYPQLKASKNFRTLMNGLVDTEERIAYSRVFYNRNVRKLNTLVVQFPFSMVALLFGLKQMDFVTISSEEKAVPAVTI